MSKELPYFKFEPSEWQNGDIQMCDFETQIRFLDICCAYWTRVGVLPYAYAMQKVCGGNANALKTLEKYQIIKVEGELIRISFLDRQLEELQSKSEKARESAEKRWKAAKNDANASETQSERNANRREENRIEKKKKENNIEERKLKFASTLEEFKDLYPRDMLNAFYRYWSEPNKSNTKFKQELEKTWDLAGRLTTWANRDRTFNKQNNQTQQQKPQGATNQYYRDPTPEDDRIKRMRSQINLYTAKVKKDYVLGVNYTENDLQDYLEKNINGYSRNQSYL